MKRCIAVPALVCALITVCHADAAKEAKQAMLTGYRHMSAAYVTSNVAALKPYFAPTCTFRTGDEPTVLNTAQFLVATKALLGHLKILSTDVKILSVKPGGGGYVANIRWTGVSVPKPNTGAKHVAPLTVHQTLLDTWRKIDGRWRIVKRLNEK